MAKELSVLWPSVRRSVVYLLLMSLPLTSSCSRFHMASDAPPPADAAVRVRRRRQKRESEGRSKQVQKVRRYPQTLTSIHLLETAVTSGIRMRSSSWGPIHGQQSTFSSCPVKTKAEWQKNSNFFWLKAAVESLSRPCAEERWNWVFSGFLLVTTCQRKICNGSGYCLLCQWKQFDSLWATHGAFGRSDEETKLPGRTWRWPEAPSPNSHRPPHE